MSTQDKNRADDGDSAELTAGSAMAENGAPTLPLVTAQPDQSPGETEQSRLFNSWLDRALPRLMEYLGASPSSAVTTPSPKAKH